MTEAVLSILYSLIGFCFGFLAGRVTREVHEIKEAVVPETFATEDAAHHARATALGIVVIILSVLTVASSAATTYQVWRQTDCIREYNGKFTEAFNARAKANDDDRKALNTMILGIGDPNLDKAQRAALFANYIATVKASDATRAKTPLPQPPNPNKLCTDEK